MTGHQLTGGWVIWLSLLVALLLSVAPLPLSLMFLRPLWVDLFFIYWAMTLPHRVSLMAAWILGVLLDVMLGTLLGQNALVLIFIVYITLLFQQKIRPQPILRQCLIITIILTLAQLLQIWINALTGRQPNSLDLLDYIIPIITSVILWPWLAAALRALQIRMRVN